MRGCNYRETEGVNKAWSSPIVVSHFLLRVESIIPRPGYRVGRLKSSCWQNHLHRPTVDFREPQVATLLHLQPGKCSTWHVQRLRHYTYNRGMGAGCGIMGWSGVGSVIVYYGTWHARTHTHTHTYVDMRRSSWHSPQQACYARWCLQVP